MTSLIQAAELYYADKPIPEFVERLIFEICTAHYKGKKNSEIAHEFGVIEESVKTVIKAEKNWCKTNRIAETLLKTLRRKNG